MDANMTNHTKTPLAAATELKVTKIKSTTEPSPTAPSKKPK